MSGVRALNVFSGLIEEPENVDQLHRSQDIRNWVPSTLVDSVPLLTTT